MRIEDKELENLMSGENIEPEAQWQSTALENVKKSVTSLNTESINYSNLNFISMHMQKRRLLIMGAVAFVLLFSIVATTLVVLNLSKSQNKLDESKILEQIALNNPGFNQSLNSYSSAADASALTRESYTGDAKLIAPAYPVNQDYNYYYSKSTTTRGPAFNSCNFGVDQSQNIFVPVSESYNYNDGLNYYSKYVGYNTDNSINSLYISKSSSTDTTSKYEDIIYYGGSYAVHTSNEYSFDDTLVKPMVDDTNLESVSEPELYSQETADGNATDSSVTSSDLLSVDPYSYFGENTSVLRTETISGKEYYVVQSYYEVDCAGYFNPDRWNSTAVEDNRTMYNITYASVDSYQILRYETYLDSVDANNLIESTETINEVANIDYASVSSNFELSINVPVREIEVGNSVSYPTYNQEEEIENAVNFLVSENATVIVPDSGAKNLYLYAQYTATTLPATDTNNYFSDRDFYPQGELGDKMYNSYNGIFDSVLYRSAPQSLASASYSMDNSSYSITTYSSDAVNLDIVNGMLWADIQNQQETNVNVLVNGESVSATLYSYEINQPIYSALPYTDVLREGVVDECTDDCYRSQYVLIFTINGNKYALQEYTYDTSYGDVEYSVDFDGSFRALSSGNASDLTEIRSILTDSIKGTYYDDGFGVVEPSAPIE